VSFGRSGTGGFCRSCTGGFSRSGTSGFCRSCTGWCTAMVAGRSCTAWVNRGGTGRLDAASTSLVMLEQVSRPQDSGCGVCIRGGFASLLSRYELEILR